MAARPVVTNDSIKFNSNSWERANEFQLGSSINRLFFSLQIYIYTTPDYCIELIADFRYIDPSENFSVAVLALGEGWHNFHHVFPWDYKTSELGDYRFNVTTAFLDFFAKIGWVYNLKTVSSDIVRKRVERTGNGSHELWGWGEADQTQADRDRTVVMHKKD